MRAYTCACVHNADSGLTTINIETQTIEQLFSLLFNIHNRRQEKDFYSFGFFNIMIGFFPLPLYISEKFQIIALRLVKLYLYFRCFISNSFCDMCTKNYWHQILLQKLNTYFQNVCK